MAKLIGYNRKLEIAAAAALEVGQHSKIAFAQLFQKYIQQVRSLVLVCDSFSVTKRFLQAGQWT